MGLFRCRQDIQMERSLFAPYYSDRVPFHGLPLHSVPGERERRPGDVGLCGVCCFHPGVRVMVLPDVHYDGQCDKLYHDDSNQLEYDVVGRRTGTDG